MIPESGILRTIGGGARRAASWPFRVAAARATMRMLAAMDRRELADIGLYPSDLRDASALALDHDPSPLLAARARERRANAFPAPPTAWDGDKTDEDWRDGGPQPRSSPGSRVPSERAAAL
jgi:uncharacterized protein YjiS (DUF1127 family)